MKTITAVMARIFGDPKYLQAKPEKPPGGPPQVGVGADRDQQQRGEVHASGVDQIAVKQEPGYAGDSAGRSIDAEQHVPGARPGGIHDGVVGARRFGPGPNRLSANGLGRRSQVRPRDQGAARLDQRR